MDKFTIEEKIQAVKQYLEGNDSCQTIAKELGVHKNNVQFSFIKHEYHGENAFFKNYTNYTLNLLDVLNYMNCNGTSIFETTAIFNLPNMNKKDQKPSKKSSPDKGTIKALQQELDALRMDPDGELKHLIQTIRMNTKAVLANVEFATNLEPEVIELHKKV